MLWPSSMAGARINTGGTPLRQDLELKPKVSAPPTVSPGPRFGAYSEWHYKAWRWGRSKGWSGRLTPSGGALLPLCPSALCECSPSRQKESF